MPESYDQPRVVPLYIRMTQKNDAVVVDLVEPDGTPKYLLLTINSSGLLVRHSGIPAEDAARAGLQVNERGELKMVGE